MEVDDLRLREQPPTVTFRRGKGGTGRVVPVAPEVAAALDRYLRVRKSHRLAKAGEGSLWLGDRGKGFTYDALHKALALQAAFADRLPPAARTALADVLSYVRDVPSGTGESRADAALRLLVERTERTGAELAGLRRAVLTLDRRFGLGCQRHLCRCCWRGDQGSHERWCS